MRKHSRLLTAVTPCAALLFATLWLSPLLAQEDNMPGMPPQPQVMQEPKELAVPFKHEEHNKKAKLTKCATCHHSMPGMKRGKNVKGMERRCSDCHHARPEPTDRAPSLMMVSHRICQGCHKANNKGPVNCSGCHKEEAKPIAGN